jgi:hypothetical protein
MNKELKQEWIEALRSGEYEQDTGELCGGSGDTGYTHCCLGVLAEIAGVARDRLMANDHLGKVGRDDLLGPWDSGEEGEPMFSHGDESSWTTYQRRLAAMNDNGYTFRQIADYIEREIPAE